MHSDSSDSEPESESESKWSGGGSEGGGGNDGAAALGGGGADITDAGGGGGSTGVEAEFAAAALVGRKRARNPPFGALNPVFADTADADAALMEDDGAAANKVVVGEGRGGLVLRAIEAEVV